MPKFQQRKQTCFHPSGFNLFILTAQRSAQSTFDLYLSFEPFAASVLCLRPVQTSRLTSERVKMWKQDDVEMFSGDINCSMCESLIWREVAMTFCGSRGKKRGTIGENRRRLACRRSSCKRPIRLPALSPEQDDARRTINHMIPPVWPSGRGQPYIKTLSTPQPCCSGDVAHRCLHLFRVFIDCAWPLSELDVLLYISWSLALY